MEILVEMKVGTNNCFKDSQKKQLFYFQVELFFLGRMRN